jgi:N-acetylglucosaminyldiphosphoundecaprenol N-acetyl-beta-D-mannosaminyltransferase
MGQVPVNALRFSDALDAVEQLIRTGGGAVFTPNVDHVVLAEYDVAFRAAYRRAELSLADGQPVVWASRLFTNSVPDKVSGSDLLLPLLKRAALRGWRVFLLGGAPKVAQRAAELLREQHAVDVVGIASPRVTTPPADELLDALADSLREARADLVVVALGAPKQELLIDALKDRVRPATLVGVGAALDFLVGRVARAPPWMSGFGLEWLYRLLKEPRRLWRRYLLRDPAFFGIVLRQLWSQRVGRRALSPGR